jgi:protoporphyrinogen oxidase
VDIGKKMNIGIIGGGMMGLATAFYLAKAGIKVTILEKESEVGGLSRSEEIMPGFIWDRFYHVILSTDDELLRFVDEIGLSLDVYFAETKTGFYTDGQLHSMSSTSEFLTFKPLSLWDKLRLGAGIYYASKINNWKKLEKIYVKTWLIKIFGRRNYEKMWDPLLTCKLGDAKNQVSAAFIWGTIKRLYGTRQKSSKKEMMGCVRGGYHSILSKTTNRLLERGVRIFSGHPVKRLEPAPDGKMRVITENDKELMFDKLIGTIPNSALIQIWPNIQQNFKERLGKIRYLKLVCAVLVLKNSLSPYYVTNLTDPGLPFTGFIDATNIIPPDIIGGKALVYLPKYMPPSDLFYERSDVEILKEFTKGIKQIFPGFKDDEILSSHVFKESNVQPIQEVNFSENVPPMKTPIKNFYIVNTTMILNSTLNNNEVIRLARKMATFIEKS